MQQKCRTYVKSNPEILIVGLYSSTPIHNSCTPWASLFGALKQVQSSSLSTIAMKDKVTKFQFVQLYKEVFALWQTIHFLCYDQVE